MKEKTARRFDPTAFLATIGDGRKILAFEKGETIFAQGGATDAVFYVQKGKIKLTVVSRDRERSDAGGAGRRQLFRGRWPGRPGPSHGFGFGHDGLHDPANR